MNLEQRTTALLDLVEQYRARRQAELLEPARAEARATIRAALSEARKRVSTAIAEERKRSATEIGAVEAALATDRRLATQQHAVRLLESAWNELRIRLIERWQAAPSRARWTDAYLGRALKAVPAAPGGWRIDYHPAWLEAERASQTERLRGHGLASVAFNCDPSIAAGFRIIGGHNVLDATLEGLLTDREQLQGRLLHHLQPEPS